MDRIEALSSTLSQITMYDIKSMYNQAKNAVFNVSEMEAKVREATNDEPWGASSTLMQEIAQGTFNFQNFNETMPAIYARFMEKEARQWRQIYKALQLLEYLVKNGSERVVDDARSHIATIKMLRNFYYIDEKGKDQGLNVRNRSRELVELLSDVEKIRTERRKAKANKHKYTGTGNDAMSFSSGGSRYGGFGNESFGYGGGGGGGSGSYGGSSSGDYGSRDYSGGSGFRDEVSRRGFQEYDAGDDETLPGRSNSISSPTRSPTSTNPRRSSTMSSTVSVVPKAPEPQKEVDLLSMDDDAFGTSSINTNATVDKALPALTSQSAIEGDDDFDDFQTAPTVPAVPMAPTIQPTARPMSTPLSPPLQMVSPMNLAMQPMSAVMPPMNHMGSSGFGTLTPSVASTAGRLSYMTPMAAPVQNTMLPSQPSLASARGSTVSPPPKPAASANFDDLWSMSLGTTTGATSGAKRQSLSSGTAKSIKDLEKEKAQAGIWGSGRSSSQPTAAGFGSFVGSASGPSQPAQAPASSAASGLDDLLL